MFDQALPEKINESWREYYHIRYMYFFDDLCYLQFLTIFLQFRNNYENGLVLHKFISYSCIETIVGILLNLKHYESIISGTHAPQILDLIHLDFSREFIQNVTCCNAAACIIFNENLKTIRSFENIKPFSLF